MLYLVYLITNLKNNKIYIGAHKTEDVNDDYLGSGDIIKLAIEKYGADSFSKEILHIFDNSVDMFAKEAELVNKDFIKRKDNYNIKPGGRGGITPESREKGRQTYMERFATDIEFRQRVSHIRSTTAKKTLELGLNHKFNHVHVDFIHTQKTKDKISKIHKDSGKFVGENNGQFGTMWINNPITKESIKVKASDVILCGWIKGRVVNWEKHQSELICQKCGNKGLPSKKSKYCSGICAKVPSKHDCHIDKFIEIFKGCGYIGTTLVQIGLKKSNYEWAKKVISENNLEQFMKSEKVLIK